MRGPHRMLTAERYKGSIRKKGRRNKIHVNRCGLSRPGSQREAGPAPSHMDAVVTTGVQSNDLLGEVELVSCHIPSSVASLFFGVHRTIMNGGLWRPAAAVASGRQVGLPRNSGCGSLPRRRKLQPARRPIRAEVCREQRRWVHACPPCHWKIATAPRNPRSAAASQPIPV
jgi:hypothetical protein